MRTVSIAIALIATLSVRATAQKPDTPVVVRARLPVARPPGFKTFDARPKRRVDLIEQATIEREAAWLREDRAIGKTLYTSPDEQSTFILVNRRVSSQPEVHARWDDVVLVRSGTGAIQLGDSLVGSRLRATGERSGGKFVREHQIVVHAGDVVRIPAAVPHAFIVSGSEPLEYLVIKQRRKDLPIRWVVKE
jgi:mannose-6-phosphate isomerase-like protein (cupin superfamily)